MALASLTIVDGVGRRDEAKTSKRIACRCVYSRAAADAVVVANGIT